MVWVFTIVQLLFNLCTASFDDRTNPQTQETTKDAKFCRQKKIAARRGFHVISLAACDTPFFFSFAEIFASNNSALCRISSLAFSFVFNPLQVTFGFSISTLEIRQERTSRLYLRVEIEDPCIQRDSKVFSK